MEKRLKKLLKKHFKSKDLPDVQNYLHALLASKPYTLDKVFKLAQTLLSYKLPDGTTVLKDMIAKLQSTKAKIKNAEQKHLFAMKANLAEKGSIIGHDLEREIYKANTFKEIFGIAGRVASETKIKQEKPKKYH